MTVLLLDTLSLLYRAHYALPPMTTRAGEPTSALYGLSTLLVKMLRERRPEGIAWALDSPGPTFRKQLFDGYKAGRPPVPPELKAQRARLDDLIDASGAPRFAADGFEADDVLVTLAREVSATHDVIVVSGDRDLLQTVGERTRVLFVGARGQDHVLYDEAKLRARFGVAPSQLASLMALVGDPSDAIPGVPGVGVKTAAAWIAARGDVRGLLAHLDDAKPPRLRERVRERAAQLELNERIARLSDDVPLPDGPRFSPIDDDALARLRGIFLELELRSLLPRIDALRSR